MLRWHLSRTSHFFSDWLWPCCAFSCCFHFFYRLSDCVEILRGFMKCCFKQILKVSALYLDKQKRVLLNWQMICLPKPNFYLIPKNDSFFSDAKTANYKKSLHYLQIEKKKSRDMHLSRTGNLFFTHESRTYFEIPICQIDGVKFLLSTNFQPITKKIWRLYYWIVQQISRRMIISLYRLSDRLKLSSCGKKKFLMKDQISQLQNLGQITQKFLNKQGLYSLFYQITSKMTRDPTRSEPKPNFQSDNQGRRKVWNPGGGAKVLS